MTDEEMAEAVVAGLAPARIDINADSPMFVTVGTVVTFDVRIDNGWRRRFEFRAAVDGTVCGIRLPAGTYGELPDIRSLDTSDAELIYAN